VIIATTRTAEYVAFVEAVVCATLRRYVRGWSSTGRLNSE
jgi:hypothetical protein